VNASVLQKAIPSNYTKYDGKESNGCRVLEVGINEASILMIRHRQLKISLGSLLATVLRLFIRNLNIFKKSVAPGSGKNLSWPDGSFAEFNILAGGNLRINH
jgi:hypothetical protein